MAKICNNCACYEVCFMANHYRTEDCNICWQPIIVKCKDCKHYKPQKKSAQWHGTTPYCCRCTTVKVSPDDFCSYGEKKVNADPEGEIDFDYNAED